MNRSNHSRLFRPDDTEDTDKTFTLSQYFFDASALKTSDWIDSALRGLTKQVPRTIDTRYTPEIQHRLFR